VKAIITKNLETCQSALDTINHVFIVIKWQNIWCSQSQHGCKSDD